MISLNRSMKSAARVVLELKDKMSKDMVNAYVGTADKSASAPGFVSNSNLSEAAEALTVLGYDKNTVLSALKGIDASDKDVGEIIKLALKKLSR